MPKPEIEFTHVSTLTSAPLTPSDPSKSGNATIRVLSNDPKTGDQTSVLYHPPGSSWGAPICLHEYWEEAYILGGRIYDETLQKWFEKGSFCCRPPWMKHGPYKADPEVGCEEICYWRYPTKAETGSKILPTTMRKSTGMSAVSPSNQTGESEVQKQTGEREPKEPQESAELQGTEQSVSLVEGDIPSPLGPKKQSRLAAYLANGERRPKAQNEGAVLGDRQRNVAQTVEQPEGGSKPGPSIVNSQSRLAAYIASEDKRPKVGANHEAPAERAQDNAKSRSEQNRTLTTPKRQSRLAAYLASDEKRPKGDEDGPKLESQPMSLSTRSASGEETPPRQSRLAAYRSAGRNS